MSIAVDRIAVVIPTVGRCEELRRLLRSLARQTRIPDQVVIVDEAGEGRILAGEFLMLSISAVTLQHGSASAKRNRGVNSVPSEIKLIAFMDDDTELEPRALEAMLEFWRRAPEDVGGASFNWMNQPPVYAPALKRLPFVKRLGLYDPRCGQVTRSGFHTVIGVAEEDRFVEWLPAGATVFPRRVLQRYAFDEWFHGYSYLEDLDFSYTLGKHSRLAVVADAHFWHFPSPLGRMRPYLFGKREVVNRLYFVRKHPELSLGSCLVALMIRMLISVFRGVVRAEGGQFRRAGGNLVGLACSLSGRGVWGGTARARATGQTGLPN